MKRTTDALRVSSLVCMGLFAWAIAAEIDFLPRLSASVWFRWQVSLLAGLVFLTCGDHLAEWRCRCCGAEEIVLRAVFTRSHELLCHRCLHWNPSLETVPVPSTSKVQV